MGNSQRSNKEDRIMRHIIKYVMITIVGLGLVLISVPAFSAQVAGKTSTQNAPIQSSTQTAPLPSKTKTVTLPSTTREYQQVDKPPVKRLDIPDWDLAGELRNLRSVRKTVGGAWNRHKVFNGLKFQLALMNKGKLQGKKPVLVKMTVLNNTTNTLIKEKTQVIRGQDIRNNMWNLTPYMGINFRFNSTTASSLNDVKLIVDIDPRNIFGEAKRHRGNNRCVATW